MMNMKIEHIAIWTQNLEQLKTFYETYFQAYAGQKYENPKKGFVSYFLSFQTGARLELMHSSDLLESVNNNQYLKSGYAHLAVSVGSKEYVDELTARLERDGYQRIDGPRYTGDGYYESVILDPDGNRIEITI